MSVPVLSVSSSSALNSTADVLVVGALSSGSSAVLHADDGFSAIGEIFDAIGVTGSADQLVRIPASVGSAGSIAIIGLGSDAGTDSLRNAAGSAVRQLAGAGTVAFAFPTASAADVEAILEGAALGGYTFTAYRNTSLDSAKPGVTDVTVHIPQGGDEGSFDAVVERAGIVADAVAQVKDLVNTPPGDLYPAALAQAATDAVSELPIDVTTWDEDALAADGFGGILGVGQGSSRGPRLVKLAYSPDGATKHLALVGKGITFDTGGLDIKPGDNMLAMKTDMSGAAIVLAVLAACRELAVPVKVTGLLALAENAVGGAAYRPGDVVTQYGGRTVEIGNTDAEGRIVMADALAYADLRLDPTVLLDIATLTGAARVALGRSMAPVYATDDSVTRALVGAGEATGELLWPMPLVEDYRKNLDSDVADINHIAGIGGGGGSISAALFLREFVGARRWAHLDIAGVGRSDVDRGLLTKGGTGFGARLLLAWLEEMS